MNLGNLRFTAQFAWPAADIYELSIVLRAHLVWLGNYLGGFVCRQSDENVQRSAFEQAANEWRRVQ